MSLKAKLKSYSTKHKEVWEDCERDRDEGVCGQLDFGLECGIRNFGWDGMGRYNPQWSRKAESEVIQQSTSSHKLPHQTSSWTQKKRLPWLMQRATDIPFTSVAVFFLSMQMVIWRQSLVKMLTRMDALKCDDLNCTYFIISVQMAFTFFEALRFVDFFVTLGQYAKRGTQFGGGALFRGLWTPRSFKRL